MKHPLINAITILDDATIGIGDLIGNEAADEALVGTWMVTKSQLSAVRNIMEQILETAAPEPSGDMQLKPVELKADNWADRPKGMVCGTCRFYVPKVSEDDDAVIGRCRHNPPEHVKGWPAVFPSDWCGQHKLDENKL